MNILAAGAGADEGLDRYLERMIVEQQQKRLEEAQAESVRHNQATEENTRGVLEMNQQYRQDQQADRRKATELLETSRLRDDAQALGNNIPPGTELGEKDPAAVTMQQGGAGPLLRAHDERPSVNEGPLEPFDSGGARLKGFTKLPSFSQEEKLKEKKSTRAGTLEEQPNGEMVRVNDDNNSEPVYGPDGKPLRKYHPPQQPDRVLIQSGEGYIPRSEASKKLANGESVPLATTGSTRTMQEGAQMLAPHIPKLAARAQALDQAGLFGPFMSRVRGLMAHYGTTLESQDPDESSRAWQSLGREIGRASTDRQTGAFAASLGLMATGAGRTHGGARGGASSQMLEHFKGMLSDSGTLDMFLGRLDALQEYISGYAAGPGKEGASGGAPTLNPGGPKIIRYDMKGNVIP